MDVTKEAGAILGQKIVDKALQYKGRVTYVFGADDIEGGRGDCSAFTEYIYSLFGIEIGPNTDYQYRKGVAVARENLNYGDLVFFKDTYNSGHIDGVSHVGIYIGGDQFINLNSNGCVVSSLNDSYWSKHWLGARRVIDQEDGDQVESLGNTSTKTDTKWWDVSSWWQGWELPSMTDVVAVVFVIIVMLMGLAFTGVSIYEATN